MDKYSRYSYNIRNFIIFIIGANIISRFIYTPKKLAIFITFFLVILTNDYLRHRGFFLKKSNGANIHIISLLLSMIGGCILVYFVRGYSDIYMFMVIYEIVFFTNGSLLKLLVSLQLILIFITIFMGEVPLSTIFSLSFIREHGVSILMSLLFIMMYIFFCLSTKAEMREKAKVTKLNKELEESYAKLQEYSARIEELIVAKERNRVAQEIHDSLGHSLTAIIMHLDYIEKIVLNDSNKAKEIVVKTQNLARNSIDQVRMAVYALKDSNSLHRGLVSSIKDMIGSIEVNEGISVKHCLDEKVEDLSPNIKDILYKTIQEGLTNGINHGKSTEFRIEVQVEEEKLHLKIQDNGRGCKDINKGNGLFGIEERVKLVSGEVGFESVIGEGFIILISIPIEEGLHEEDKAGAC